VSILRRLIDKGNNTYSLSISISISSFLFSKYKFKKFTLKEIPLAFYTLSVAFSTTQS